MRVRGCVVICAFGRVDSACSGAIEAFRVLRVFRLFRVFKGWESMTVVLEAVESAVRGSVVSLVFLFLYLFVFALIGMHSFGE
jgi:hypothetical protein